MKFYFFLFSFSFFACQSPDSSSTTATGVETEETTIPDESSIAAQRIINSNKVMTYANYRVQVEENDADLVVKATTPEGKALEAVNMTIGGNVRQMELIDMNEDDRPELVVISTDENGEEQLEVRSLTTNASLPVYLDQRALNAEVGTSNYEIRNGRIYHTYLDATNQQKRSSSYNLVAGEAGFRLEPHGISLEELNTQVYGEYVSDPYPNTYAQQLSIRDNGLGEIVVNFKAATGDSDREDCKLEAIGRLVNGAIQVPLSYFERSMSGHISLNSTKEGWEVTVPSPEQQAALNQLCSGGAGILGKYKRVSK